MCWNDKLVWLQSRPPSVSPPRWVIYFRWQNLCQADNEKWDFWCEKYICHKQRFYMICLDVHFFSRNIWYIAFEKWPDRVKVISNIKIQTSDITKCEERNYWKCLSWIVGDFTYCVILKWWREVMYFLICDGLQ